MKKNDLLILGTTLLYSILFYHQSAGVNFFLFSVTLCLLMFLNFNEHTRSVKWRLAATGTLLSGFAVYYLDNSLAVCMNVLSLSLLAAFTFEPRTSVISAWCYSFFTLFTAIGYIVLGGVARSNQNRSDVPAKRIRPLTLVLPVLILLFFFFIYRQGNALFYDFTKNWNLDFISFSWICFTIGGFILMYSLFKFRVIPELLLLENRLSDKLVEGQSAAAWMRRILPLSQEYLSGLILLVMLNLLTCTLNLLDCKFLFLDGKLPQGMSYSEFVHTGVGALIFSIVIAIFVILFYFRAELNFMKGRKALAGLTYLWIAQNLFMLYTGATKNGMYIHEYTLTYRRIGVYAWLLLALFGLMTTAYKIYGARTNYFLFRINIWLCYGTVVVASLFNWDSYIAEYNISYSRNVDYGYLLSLSYNTLPPILKACQDPRIANKELLLNEEELRYFYGRAEGQHFKLKDYLNGEMAGFLEAQLLAQWQSSSLRKNSVEKELKSIRIPNESKIITYSNILNQ
jgi:hypothetical protein